MYAKLFSSIYQGTLRGDSHGLLVFTNLLAHDDGEGWVDIHPRVIAEETGLKQRQVEAALRKLEAPDPESRSKEEEGRRIIRIDDHRTWGWRIVNSAKYRAIRSLEDRREQNRLAQERWRKRHKPTTSDNKIISAESAQEEEEVEVEAVVPSSFLSEKTQVLVDVGPSTRARKHLPDCPCVKIVADFHETLPELGEVITPLSKARHSHVQTRWREVCKADKLDEEAGLAFFHQYFQRIRGSKFLMGKRPPKQAGGRSFRANFDWIFNEANFLKVLEGRYDE